MLTKLGRSLPSHLRAGVALLALAGGWLLAPAPTSAQAPALGELIFEDNFDGNSLGTSWTVTGTTPPTVAGGEVTVSNGTSIRLAPGFLECPIIFLLDGVRFSNISGQGSGAGLNIRTLGNGSVSNGGSNGYDWSYYNGQYFEGHGYGQNGLDGYSILSTGPTYDTTARTYTLALDTTGSLIYASGWFPGYYLNSSYPTINSGRSAITLFARETASATCSRVRVYRAVPSTTRQVRFIERRTTATLDFSPYKLTAVSSNFNSTTYGTLTVEQQTSSPATLPRPALNNTIWNVAMSPSNLSSMTTTTHTFNSQDVLALGGDPATLKGYKSVNGGQTWTEVPNCLITLNGANSTFTFGGQSTFSHFAIGYAALSAVREWELYD